MKIDNSMCLGKSSYNDSVLIPWPGLASYDDPETSNVKKCFYGRDDESYDIFRLIECNHFVTLYGKSGIGKTSLLKAGVFPELRHKNYLPVYLRLGMKDKTQSFQELIIKSIENLVHEVNTINVIDEQYDQDKPNYLWNYFARHRFFDKDGESLIPVIVLDQFEELLRHNRVETEFLLRQIDYAQDRNHILDNEIIDGELYRYQQNFRFVISIREDYLYQLEDSIDTCYLPALKCCRYRLLPLYNDQAEDIIRKPIPGLISREVAEEIISKVANCPISNFRLGDGERQIEVDAAMLSLFMHELFRLYINNKIDTEIPLSLVKEVGDNIIKTFYQDRMSKISSSTVNYLEDHLVTDEGIRNCIFEYQALQDGIEEWELRFLQDQRIIHKINWYDSKDRIEFMHDRLCPIIKEFKEQRKSEEQLKAYELEQQQLKDEKEVERTKRNIEYNKRKRATNRNLLLQKGRKLLDNALDFGENRCWSMNKGNGNLDALIDESRLLWYTLCDLLETESDTDFVNQQVFSDPLLNDSSCILKFYAGNELKATLDGLYGIELKYEGTLISDIVFRGKKVLKDGRISYTEPIYILGGYCGIHIDYENGMEIQRTYLDENHYPIITQDGYSIVRTKYNECGYPISIRYYNFQEGVLCPARHVHGNYGFDSIFDKNGSEIERYFVDELGNPIAIASGVYGKRLSYDSETFQLNSISNIDCNGILMEDKDGYVTQKTLYNKTLNQIQNIYLDKYGHIWQAPDGTCGTIETVDYHKKTLTGHFVDANGIYVANSAGVYSIICKFNEKRQIIEYYEKDANDDIITKEGGTVYRMFEYDELNRQKAVRFLSKNRKFISGYALDYNKEGIHVIRQFALSEWGYGKFDNDVAGIEFVLNKGENLPPLQLFVNENKQYVACSDGYNARRIWEDDRERVVKELYYDVKGQPMVNSEKVYGKKIEYIDEDTTKYINIDAYGNIMEDNNGVAFTIVKETSDEIIQKSFNSNSEPFAADNRVCCHKKTKMLDVGYQEIVFVQNAQEELINITQTRLADANWEPISCVFNVTNYDNLGRPVSQYFYDENNQIVGDSSLDSYTIWEYEDENNIEILSLYNIHEELTIRIKTKRDNKGRIIEHFYLDQNNQYAKLDHGYCGELYEYDDVLQTKTISYILSDGIVSGKRKLWYDKKGRVIAQHDMNVDRKNEEFIGFREFVDNQEIGCAYYIHEEDENGKIKQFDNGSFYVYYEDDEKGRTIKEFYLDSNKIPIANKYGDYGLEYKYDDSLKSITKTCLDEEGQPHNNALGYGIVRVHKDEQGREIKQRYYTLEGEPATFPELLGCYGLSYEYPNEHNKIVGYLNEDGEITLNNYGYAYREECIEKGAETEIKKVFYYDNLQSNIQSTEDENKDYGYAIVEEGNIRRIFSLDKNGMITNNACGFAVRTELIKDGRLRLYKYVTCEGKPISDSKGDYGVELQYSDDGSVTRRISLNAKYEPHVNNYGYCICDEITAIDGDKVYVCRDMDENQVLPKLRFVQKIKNNVSKIARKEQLRPIFNCRQMGTIYNCILWNIESNGLKKKGLNGTYILLRYEDWHFGNDSDKFEELLLNTKKISKHTMLLPVSLKGPLLQQVGDIIEVDFPAGEIDMTFADWGINEDTIRVVVEKLEKRKEWKEHVFH